MSWYKDQWNERYYDRFEAALEGGATKEQAEGEAEVYANELAEHLLDAADNLRKERKEQGL
jgi:hypothetical protein